LTIGRIVLERMTVPAPCAFAAILAAVNGAARN
jgi:hypothetical protein